MREISEVNSIREEGQSADGALSEIKVPKKKSGITDFTLSLRMIEGEKDEEKKKEHKEKILQGFGDHAQMAISMLRSSLIMELTAQGSDEVQWAVSSRWSKIRINQIRISGKKPVAISVEFFFIQEHTSHDDPTEEVHSILEKYISRMNYDSFIVQLVVNSKIVRFDNAQK